VGRLLYLEIEGGNHLPPPREAFSHIFSPWGKKEKEKDCRRVYGLLCAGFDNRGAKICEGGAPATPIISPADDKSSHKLMR